MSDLTKAQRRVLVAIIRHWQLYGGPPSIRDLQERCGFGSPNAVAGHLRTLERKGAIECDHDGTARCIWPAGLRTQIKLAAIMWNGASPA